jgi:hypothetical protein
MKPKTLLVGTSLALVLALLAARGGAHTHPLAGSPQGRPTQANTIAHHALEGGSLSEALEKGAALGEAYSLETLKVELGRELSDAERETVRGIMRDALGEVLTPELWSETLISVCTEYFTAGELHEINEFFQSSTGSKFLSIESQLSDAVNDQADAVFEQNIDAFIARVDEGLGQAFPELVDEAGQ